MTQEFNPNTDLNSDKKEPILVAVGFMPNEVIDAKTFNWDSYISNNGEEQVWLVHPTVRNNNDVSFESGETVGHQGSEETALINGFILDPAKQDILAVTSKGTASIQFLLKI